MSKKSSTRNVSVNLSRQARSRTGACVNGIDLVVEEGAFVSIVGPSGFGKTTIYMPSMDCCPSTAVKILVNINALQGPASIAPWVSEASGCCPGDRWATSLRPQATQWIGSGTTARYKVSSIWSASRLREALSVGTLRGCSNERI